MKTKLSIMGMHCSSCAMSIDDELEDVLGVKRASTSYAKQTAEVEYDPAVASIGSLIRAVSAAGYSASIKE